MSDVVTDHVHHWIIDRPTSATSWGYCECGESREFYNHENVDSRTRFNGKIAKSKAQNARAIGKARADWRARHGDESGHYDAATWDRDY